MNPFKYEYWKCSDDPKNGFGVKNIKTNTYFAGDEVIDLINQLSSELFEYEVKYLDEKDKTEHYRAVLKDLINNGDVE